MVFLCFVCVVGIDWNNNSINCGRDKNLKKFILFNKQFTTLFLFAFKFI